MENTIVECIFDMQFKSDYVVENFLSVISNIDGFENIIKLPLHQVPEVIRKNDPNLKLQPLYEITSLKNRDYKITLGDNVIGIAILKSYTSWSKSFYPQIEKVFTEILATNKINFISRVGLRYVDFLESENIFLDKKVNLSINGEEITEKKVFLKIEDSLDNIDYNKIITNHVKYKNSKNSGSIIDIVTSKKDIPTNDLEDIFQTIQKLHVINEKKFKEVIGDDYVRKYKL
jgi:uncharacterized protein (TIGR04255 family)